MNPDLWGYIEPGKKEPDRSTSLSLSGIVELAARKTNLPIRETVVYSNPQVASGKPFSATENEALRKAMEALGYRFVKVKFVVAEAYRKH